jgi:hypothetical protein
VKPVLVTPRTLLNGALLGPAATAP